MRSWLNWIEFRTSDPTVIGSNPIGRTIFIMYALLAQLEELVETARKLGAAVGLGHPYPETLRALSKVLPELENEGIELVFVSELVK